jgi:hypothetical protein
LTWKAAEVFHGGAPPYDAGHGQAVWLFSIGTKQNLVEHRIG